MSRSATLLFAGALSASALLAASPASAGCWSCGCAPRAVVYAAPVASPCAYPYWGRPVYVVNQGPRFGEPIPAIAPASVGYDPLAYPYVYEDYGYLWPGYSYGWRGYRPYGSPYGLARPSAFRGYHSYRHGWRYAHPAYRHRYDRPAHRRPWVRRAY